LEIFISSLNSLVRRITLLILTSNADFGMLYSSLNASQLIFPDLSKRNTMAYRLTVSRACCNVEKTSRIFPRREEIAKV